MSITMTSSQSRLFESRISLIEQTLRQQTKKILNIDHNLISFSSKQEYLQNCIAKLSIKVDELSKDVANKRYGLNDITMTGYGNFNSGKNTGVKQNNSNQHFLQLLQALQTMTLSNLEQLEKKFTISNNDIESKCGNMELKFMGIWKQAESLIQSLTYEIQSCQHKIRSMQDRRAYEKDYLQNSMRELQDHLNQFVNRSNDKFIEQIQSLHQQIAVKIGSLEEIIAGFVKEEQLQKIKKQIQRNLQKVSKTIDEKFQQTLHDVKTDINSKTQTTIKNYLNKFQQKLSHLEKQYNSVNQKIQTIQLSLNQALKQKTNFTVQNAYKQSNQILNGNQNPQGSYQRWSQNSFQNLGIAKKPLPPQKKLEPSMIVQNKLLSQQNYSTNRLESRYQQQKNERIDERNDEQEMVVRGIGGLRSLRKKEEERKGSLSRGKRHNEEIEMNEASKQFSRGDSLRPISGTESPSKGNKKPLPPLASQKTFSRQPQHKPPNKYNNLYQQSNSQQQQSGEQSYFLDQQGYLIDREGNRLINQDGQQIQLSSDDLEKLKQLNQQGY